VRNLDIDIDNLMKEGIHIKFRSKMHENASGCAAMLGDDGSLKIIKASEEFSTMGMYDTLWATRTDGGDDDEDEIDSRFSSHMFKHYFLELRSDGELTVRSIRGSESDDEPECVWSTESCNEYVAVLKDVGVKLMKGLKNFSFLLKTQVKSYFLRRQRTDKENAYRAT